MAKKKTVAKSTSRDKKTTSKKAATQKGTGFLDADNKYCKVLIDKIKIVERPEEGQESDKIFYNPRSLESITPEYMANLAKSIQTTGLMHPVAVRILTKNDKIQTIELIAGECRLRSILKLIEENRHCYDQSMKRPVLYKPNDIVIYRDKVGAVKEGNRDETDVLFNGEDEVRTVETSLLKPTQPAKQLYTHISALTIYDVDEWEALHLAYTENEDDKPLTTAEEINLVERLVRMGLKQEEIVERLQCNVTWVSQTSSFRNQLPTGAFERLLDNRITRNVAVSILAYGVKDREKLFQQTVVAEEEETAATLKKLAEQKAQHEDCEDLALDEASKAQKSGKTAIAQKARKRAVTAGNRAKQAGERQERTQSQAGKIRQGHVRLGAVAAGVTTKKAKILTKDEIETHYLKPMKDLLGEDVYPDKLLLVAISVATGIIEGKRDPLIGIRNVTENENQLDQFVSEDDESSDDGQYDTSTDDYAENFEEERDFENELDNLGYGEVE